MTPVQVAELSERERLMRCARDAAMCNYYRHLGPVAAHADLSYLDNASDDRLRQIIRSVFRTDDPVAVLLRYPEYQGMP